MTFSTKQLVEIGRMFTGFYRNDTIEIARKMDCDCSEADIYNALTAARAAYYQYLRERRAYRQAASDRQRVA